MLGLVECNAVGKRIVQSLAEELIIYAAAFTSSAATAANADAAIIIMLSSQLSLAK